MVRSKRLGRLLLGLALLASAAFALPSTGLPPGLDDARLAILPAPVRQDVQRHADAWARMTPAEQRNFRERLRAWDALPLPVRRDRREIWQAWLALPADQRLQVRAAALAYAALPGDQQQALRTEFEGADASQRRGWRLGPALGASYTVLQPLLMQVPGNERAPLLLALRAMDAAQRDALGMLAQRTAPAQRDALRRELISTSAANRGRWLDARLAR